MDHRGHPKRPLDRCSLPLGGLSESFITASREEDPGLAKALARLDEPGKALLGGVLGRFDLRGQGELDGQQRLMARRLLARLHKPGIESLVLTNKILDYLDVNTSAVIEEDELELCVKIFELFSRADSPNETLSTRELAMLYAVLRHLDQNENGRLDAAEREALLRGLADPAVFMAEQRVCNPYLMAVLETAP
jgi:hypothetical protein